MVYRLLNLNLKQKLLLLLLLSSALSVVLLGFTLSFMTRQLHREESDQTFSAARHLVTARLRAVDEAVRQQAIALAARADVVSAVNMVFRYQRPEEYQPWVFDTEKKHLARKLQDALALQPGKADERRIAVYDGNDQLLSFAVGMLEQARAGYVSFENGRPAPLVTDGQSERWLPGALPKQMPFTCIHDEMATGFRLYQGGELAIRAAAPVLRALPGGTATPIGHVVVSERVGPELLATLSADIGTHLTIVPEQGAATGALTEADLRAGWREAAEPLDGSLRGPRLETDHHFLRAYSLTLVDGRPAYVILSIAKAPVIAQITRTRNIVLGVLVLVAVVVIPLGLAVARRTISDPVRRLVDDVAAVEAGRYDLSPARNAMDELGVLARSIRKMAQTIRDREGLLRESRASLAEAQRLARLGNWDWDCRRGRLLCSDEVFRILGVPSDQISGDFRFLLPFVHADDQEQVAALLRAAAERGEDYETDYRIVRPDGDIQVVQERLEVRLGADGRPCHLLGTVQVVTELKRTEQELREAKAATESHLRRSQEELEAARNQLLQSEKMAAIGQLAAGVAHEINNPIGYINSNFHTLQQYVEQLETLFAAYGEVRDQLPDGDPLKDRLAEAERMADLPFLRDDLPNLIRESREGGERVKKIVLDLKNFARQDTPEWELARVEEMCEQTLNIVWNELKYKADVVREYGDTPPIRCLPVQLGQVLVNLLVNAVQSIPERGVITVRTGMEHGRVFVEVQDTGAGIQADHLPHLFEPFFTTKPVGSGTGLGLSVSYTIVQRHGGEIRVDSTPGIGSRFRVLLPVDGAVADVTA